jgi:hypothetical protein
LANLCPFAALNGYFKILKWAIDVGCPLNQRTFYNATSGGHLEILKWATENGCPSDDGREATTSWLRHDPSKARTLWRQSRHD